MFKLFLSGTGVAIKKIGLCNHSLQLKNVSFTDRRAYFWPNYFIMMLQSHDHLVTMCRTAEINDIAFAERRYYFSLNYLRMMLQSHPILGATW